MGNDYLFLFFLTQFLCLAICTQRPEGTQVIVGSTNMGYISDTARNRIRNVFRPKLELIPLGHNNGLEHWETGTGTPCMKMDLSFNPTESC